MRGLHRPRPRRGGWGWWLCAYLIRGLGMSSFVGRVERGAFASALSGFGVVPVHPPSPYAARIRRPSRALNPRSSPRAAPPSSPTKWCPVSPDGGRVRRFGWRSCRLRRPISDTRRDRSGGRPCAPRLGRTGIPPAAHCSIVLTRPPRDTTLAYSISERSRRALFGGYEAAEAGLVPGARPSRREPEALERRAVRTEPVLNNSGCRTAIVF